MRLTQFQAGYDNEQMLGEEPVQDGAQSEEESSGTDDEMGVKSGNQTDEIDSKVEREDHASVSTSANFDQSEEPQAKFNTKSEVESSNSSSGVDKLESIFEDEMENLEEVDLEAASNEESIFEENNMVNADSQEGFEGRAELVIGDLKKQHQMTKTDLKRKQEELVYLREGAAAQAVLYITRQYKLLTISVNRVTFFRHDSVLQERAGGRVR